MIEDGLAVVMVDRGICLFYLFGFVLDPPASTAHGFVALSFVIAGDNGLIYGVADRPYIYLRTLTTVVLSRYGRYRGRVGSLHAIDNWRPQILRVSCEVAVSVAVVSVPDVARNALYDKTVATFGFVVAILEDLWNRLFVFSHVVPP